MVDYPAQWARPIFEDPSDAPPVDVPITAAAAATATLGGTLGRRGSKHLSASFEATPAIVVTADVETRIHLTAGLTAHTAAVLGARTSLGLTAELAAETALEGLERIRVYRRLTGGLTATTIAETLKPKLRVLMEDDAFDAMGAIAVFEGILEANPALVGPPGGMLDPFTGEWIFEPADDDWEPESPTDEDE